MWQWLIKNWPGSFSIALERRLLNLSYRYKNKIKISIIIINEQNEQKTAPTLLWSELINNGAVTYFVLLIGNTLNIIRTVQYWAFSLAWGWLNLPKKERNKSACCRFWSIPADPPVCSPSFPTWSYSSRFPGSFKTWRFMLAWQLYGILQQLKKEKENKKRTKAAKLDGHCWS